MVQILHRTVPGAAHFQAALGNKGFLSQGMDASITAQSPLGRKRQIESLFAEVQHILPLHFFIQPVRHNADDGATVLQAAFLGSPVGAPGIA